MWHDISLRLLRIFSSKQGFARFISNLKLNDHEVLVSFDIVSFFTKVIVDLAVDIARQRLLACDDLTMRTKCSVDNIM